MLTSIYYSIHLLFIYPWNYIVQFILLSLWWLILKICLYLSNTEFCDWESWTILDIIEERIGANLNPCPEQHEHTITNDGPYE